MGVGQVYGLVSPVQSCSGLFSLLDCLFLLAQRIEVDTTRAQKLGVSLPPNELNRAWKAIQPMYPHFSLSATQSSWGSLLFLLGGGLLLASTLGWLGGMFGSAQHKKHVAKKLNRVP